LPAPPPSRTNSISCSAPLLTPLRPPASPHQTPHRPPPSSPPLPHPTPRAAPPTSPRLVDLASRLIAGEHVVPVRSHVGRLVLAPAVCAR
jgi:hypothetical protein